MNTIYLDHSATTKVHPLVVEAMKSCWETDYGNPSSLHHKGRQARQYVDNARQSVAQLINADPKEIIFTGGGTEADNLAVLGAVSAQKSKGKHIITSQIEHHAVLNTCVQLSKQGYEVTFLPVDKQGVIDPADLKKAVRDDTILVTIMHANNEVGTVQPIGELAAIAAAKGVTFHTDAVQSLGKIRIDLAKLPVSLMSFSGHKIYGPKGVGVLYIRKGTKITPLQLGGHHEFNRRAGTENVPGIVGIARAMELVHKNLEADSARIAELRDYLESQISSRITDIQVNGHRTKRLPNMLNITFKYVEGEGIILNLDSSGICVSSGSACTSESLEPSHVLSAMSVPAELAHGSIRFSLGRENTKAEIEFTLDCLVKTVQRLREMSPLYKKK
ncbi:MAG: cysteine desulfurase NifS [Candidatus Brocadiia bacterium]